MICCQYSNVYWLAFHLVMVMLSDVYIRGVLGKLRRAQICCPGLSSLPDEGPAGFDTRGWRMLAYWAVLAVAWPLTACLRLQHISTPVLRTAAALGRLIDKITVPPGQLNGLAHT